MSSKKFSYGKDKLTYRIAIKIAVGEVSTMIDSSQSEKIMESRKKVESISSSNNTVYGINTGFGALCNTIISSEDSNLLQENLLKSHAVGVGKKVPKIISKLMMIIKVHSLCMGHSGVRIDIIDRICWHIKNNILPAVPIKGSVGASGDLAPLAHLFLPLIGEGDVYYKGKKTQSSDMLKKEKMTPLNIKEKEGLALINGTQFICAFTCYALDRFRNCLENADIISAMSVEGTMGSDISFSKELNDLRPYNGASIVSDKIRELLEDSEVIASNKKSGKVQDPYSIRCIPQVHGASWDSYLHLEKIINIELNSVTDNPIVMKDGNIISGGNFHGQPVAIPIDYSIIAASELGNISDRRIYLLLKGNKVVPQLLLKKIGINSGFMILQYTSAALVSENKNLCFPASADSITTSLGQEDHVSMGSIGAVKFLKVIKNLEKILAIELLCSIQALDFHRPLSSNKKLESCIVHVRNHISFSDKDKIFTDDIERAIKIVKSRKLIESTS